MPKGLYTRALIIIIAPIIILQSILAAVFLEAHWKVVTGRLSVATAQEIAMVAAAYDWAKDKEPGELARLSDMARDNLGLIVRFVPGEELPVTRSKPFFALLDRDLSRRSATVCADPTGSTRLDRRRISRSGSSWTAR